MKITEDMLAVINETAVRAGLAIMKIYGEYLKVSETDAAQGAAGDTAQQAIQLEYKDGKMPLTAADKASNAVIVESLRKHFPECAILSEEEKDDLSRLENPYCFVVDPLDGTKEFIKRNGQFTVNIALSENHKTVLGVIYVPVNGELYYAAKGMGAYLRKLDAGKLQEIYESELCKNKGMGQNELEKDGENESVAVLSRQIEERTGRINEAVRSEINRLTPSVLHVSDRTEDLRVVMSSSHGCEEMDRLLEKYHLTNFVKMGSSLKGCVIAKGEAEVYYRHNPTMEWDTAAMQCIVEEAGAIFRQMDDTEMCYNREDSLNAKGFYIINCEKNKLV